MVTDRLDTAVKNFQHMNQMAERYTRLCRAYVQLSERFQDLDVEHMKLKEQMVPLLKTLRAQQVRLQQVQTEKATLQQALDQQLMQHRQEMQTLTRTYEERLETLSHHIEELKPLENLISAEAYHNLTEAEAQMELVEATCHEMAEDSTPDLTTEEKALLAAYRANPSSFLAADLIPEPPTVMAYPV